MEHTTHQSTDKNSNITTEHHYAVIHYFKDFNIPLVDYFVIFYLIIIKIRYPMHKTIICIEVMQ
jgi:hypothetical protein